MNITKTLDVKGLNCPLPVLKVKKAFNEMQSGETVRVEATDVGSQSDIPAFAKQSGHLLLEKSAEGDVFVYILQKK